MQGHKDVQEQSPLREHGWRRIIVEIAQVQVKLSKSRMKRHQSLVMYQRMRLSNVML